MILFCILGFVFISIVGTLLHFVYDWSKHNKFLSLFVAVNESTWEHLKLGVIPTFVWALVGLFFGYNNFAIAVFVALLTIVVLIPTIFYSYTRYTNKPILKIDISTFFLAIGLAMLFAYFIMNANTLPSTLQTAAGIGVVCFAIVFLMFTFTHHACFCSLTPLEKNMVMPDMVKKKKTTKKKNKMVMHNKHKNTKITIHF